MDIHTFKIKNIPSVIYGGKNDNMFLFVHGRCGCKEEAERFASVACPLGYGVLSIDLPEHGERKNEVGFNPMVIVPELSDIYAFMKENCKKVFLRANSIGAYYSMLAFKDKHISKSLFVSPIVDMEGLITGMMEAENVSENALFEKRIIETQFEEPLSYEYLMYVRSNSIKEWRNKTSVLYSVKDNMTSRTVIGSFADNFGACVTITENGEHWFHTEEQLKILKTFEEKEIKEIII